MDELQIETGPINPYAKTFFWIWGIALLALAGIKAGQSTQPVQLDSVRSETSWLNTAIQQTKNVAEITEYFKPVHKTVVTLAN